MLALALLAAAAAAAPAPVETAAAPATPGMLVTPFSLAPAAAHPIDDAGGPPALRRSDAVPADDASQPYRLSGFGRDVGAARWEIGAVAAAVIVPRIYRRAKGSDPFHFHSEGFFGRDTYELGMDKMLHSWKTYVYADVIQSAIRRRTGDDRSAAITGSLIGFGLMTIAEIGDGFSRTTGFSYEDELSHVAGAGLAAVRNLVPGLREKIDYRLSIVPKLDGSLSDTRGRAANSKYFLALQLAGFDKLERSPFRFVELHLGYYARGFRQEERLRGDPLRRHIFVGIGFNVQQLFARQPRNVPERLAKGALDYIQLPYTAITS